MGKIGSQDRIRGLETPQASDIKEFGQSRQQKKICWKTVLPQVYLSLTMAFGSLIVGFATAYSSPALDSMSEDESRIQPTLEQKSWIGSLLPLFAAVGGCAGGFLIAGFGRKKVLLITGFPFILSFLLIALASNISMILVGRGLMGLCVGISTLVIPIYLGETVEPKYRGKLGLIPTTFGNFGVLLSYTAGMFLNWSLLAFLGALLPIPFIVCSYTIPESLRWYAFKGKTKSSIRALQWLRGQKDVSAEFNEIEANQNKMKNSRAGFKDLLKMNNLKPVLICLFLMFFQQMSGINAVIFYSVDIFNESETNMNPNIQCIVLGVVNVISTTAATIFIDKLGRKVLLNTSSFIMALTLAMLGLYFRATQFKDPTSSILDDFILNRLSLHTHNWIPLVCLVVYIIGFSIGFGPVPWLMMGELLPSQIKGTGASLTTAFNWACSFIVTKTFGTMISKLGADRTFWLYGLFCVLAMIFIKFFVPETSKKSLEDIEKLFQTRKQEEIERKKVTTVENCTSCKVSSVQWALSLNNIASVKTDAEHLNCGSLYKKNNVKSNSHNQINVVCCQNENTYRIRKTKSEGNRENKSVNDIKDNLTTQLHHVSNNSNTNIEHPSREDNETEKQEINSTVTDCNQETGCSEEKSEI